ncbi:hypothetical protein [Castellaniella defragrans]|uniref:PilZ domain-containing protein n=1 Tax=Castellaniella defragrans TaxID=75697 RepID=A0A7W9TR20_CASDE|nr:hypothetical protein [Castellaniella defragrans]KAB0622325.1 hypothetical protein F7Q88_03920 [Castellaniella defragrans]MBB6084448.1 hypothetical protein [Castellaniella defragrans]
MEAALELLPRHPAQASRLIASEHTSEREKTYQDSAAALAAYHQRLASELGIQAADIGQISLCSLIANSLIALALTAGITWRGIRALERGQGANPPEGPSDHLPRPKQAGRIQQQLAAYLARLGTSPAAEAEVCEQRRASFRVRVPRQHPATFTILDPTIPVFNVCLPLYDLGTGGLRLVDKDDRLGELLGHTVHGRLDFPDGPSVQVDCLLLRAREALRDGRHTVNTAAAQLQDLAPPQLVAIQQYIDRIERQLLQRAQALSRQ